MSASLRPSPSVNTTEETTWVRQEVEPSQTWLSTLLFLSQKNKILRPVLGTNRNLSKWKSNDKCQENILSLELFQFFDLTSWNKFSSSIVFSLLKWRTFLLIGKLYFIKDEDSALGLLILFKKEEKKGLWWIFTLNKSQNMYFKCKWLNCETIYLTKEKWWKFKYQCYSKLCMKTRYYTELPPERNM